MLITTCGNSVKLAKSLAQKLKANYSALTISQFPDGDLYLKYNTEVKGKIVVIVESMQPQPTESLMKILFAAETAKDLGAKKAILIAPYLAFMRQDGRFNPGEAISSKIVGKLLSNSVDKIITFDPHIHRWKSMKDIFSIPAAKLTTNSLISEYIKKNFRNEIIVGPDGEPSQWAQRIADKIGAESTVFEKKRLSSWKVVVRMKNPIAGKGKDIVIVDDIISTGHTVIEAVKELRKHGARKISVICIHAVFVEKAYEKSLEAGVNEIISTNCNDHKTNKIDVSPLLLQELRKEK